MKLRTLLDWYIYKGYPLECLMCGSTEDLTIDHLIPKSHISLKERKKKWKASEKLLKTDPEKAMSNVGLMCKTCNTMKHSLTLGQFIKHIFKILYWLMKYEITHLYYNEHKT